MNTNIDPKDLGNSGLESLHLPFKSIGRDYLKHDCFVDCGYIYDKPKDEIISILENDQKSLLGNVGESDLGDIFRITKAAKTISIKTKKKYSLFLK